MKATGWAKGLQVTADGTGIVSHAGVALVRALADNIGLTGLLREGPGGDQLRAGPRRCGSSPAASGRTPAPS